MSKEPKQYKMCVIGHTEASVIVVGNANVIIKHKWLIYIYSIYF